ncbi:MAG: hypothetical protein LBL90_10360 [Prevotellaceae bacterium]|jgi:hypothetical protein|nr:hypothetical protein [Prevotellaceae bacterium]
MKRKMYKTVMIAVAAMFIAGAANAQTEKSNSESKTVTGQLAQRLDNYDLIHVYWSFYDKGRVPSALRCSIVNGDFTVVLPAIPQDYLQKPSNFFQSPVKTSNNVNIGQACFFAYTSASRKYSGDLYPVGRGGEGHYIYAAGDINITGETPLGKLNLLLKQGWNSVVKDKQQTWIVLEIPFDWMWDQ